MMERTVPFSSAGDGASSGYVFDDACFNALFSGFSLQSFLSVNHNPPLIGGYAADAISFPDAASFYPPASLSFISESTASSDALRLPKPEPLNLYETETGSFQIQSFDFIHETSCIGDSTSFPHLPELRSLEQSSASSLMSFNKRARVDSVLSPLQTLDSIVRSCESFQNFIVPYQYKPSPDVAAPAVPASVQIPRSALARQRRQKLSDKTRCLQKLLPWDKKMDIATMLEEAYKYVKFLQAQLLVLQSMPNESAMSTSLTHYNSGSGGGVFSGLERLNRNQLLQVLVNSPVAQTILCSQSCCVFSAEQLGFIQKMEGKRAILPQMSVFRPEP